MPSLSNALSKQPFSHLVWSLLLFLVYLFLKKTKILIPCVLSLPALSFSLCPSLPLSLSFVPSFSLLHFTLFFISLSCISPSAVHCWNQKLHFQVSSTLICAVLCCAVLFRGVPWCVEHSLPVPFEEAVHMQDFIRMRRRSGI